MFLKSLSKSLERGVLSTVCACMCVWPHMHTNSWVHTCLPALHMRVGQALPLQVPHTSMGLWPCVSMSHP